MHGGATGSRDSIIDLDASSGIGGKLEPVSVYFGPLADSLEADIDAWQRFPIRRPPGGKDLSITQVLFRAIGLPEAPSLGNSNLTMHQVLRLLYADQQTPPRKLFRFESFDSRDIREVVEKVVGSSNASSRDNAR